ncbi:MAG: helix-turn-helix domain-containing protein [Rhodospirillaceae bacterium]|jgi:IclR family transcriptional regulator, mhp operon transcriptional activator|nr:helix-turn-helix domain-containing protein [Rhodospirillaceae bacterium]MBT7955166.1 helix-turn-helix domain-containing protein [Rhodospirillaceae bacterium]
MKANLTSPPKTIRALERGLEIMQILQEHGQASLNDLYQSSGLPRPTILRILRTLDQAGWIRRGLGDGLYRNSFKIERLVEGLDQSDRLAEIAAPHLDMICDKASWPAELTVLSSSGMHMELKETSRASSPFLLNRDNIGHLINFPLSSVGRAYLAFCGDDERAQIIGRLKKSTSIANRSVRNDTGFNKILDEIRQTGYATREPSFGGGQNPLKSSFDDGLDAVAVPILAKAGVPGCITLAWIRKAAPVQEIVADYLEDLQTAAQDIAAEFDN